MKGNILLKRINKIISRQLHDPYDLMQSAQEGQKTERAKMQPARYVEEKDDEILPPNELACLQMRFDRAHSDVLWESCCIHFQNTNARKTLLLGIIKIILNLFEIVSKQLKRTIYVSLEHTHEQLDLIQQFVQDLSDIWEEVKKKKKG